MAIRTSSFNTRPGTRLTTLLLLFLLFCARSAVAQNSSTGLSSLSQCSVSYGRDILLLNCTYCGALASSFPTLANPFSLPQLSCLIEGIGRSGCATLDTTCQCKSQVMEDTSSACLLANCTMQDSLGKCFVLFFFFFSFPRWFVSTGMTTRRAPSQCGGACPPVSSTPALDDLPRPALSLWRFYTLYTID